MKKFMIVFSIIAIMSLVNVFNTSNSNTYQFEELDKFIKHLKELEEMASSIREIENIDKKYYTPNKCEVGKDILVEGELTTYLGYPQDFMNYWQQKYYTYSIEKTKRLVGELKEQFENLLLSTCIVYSHHKLCQTGNRINRCYKFHEYYYKNLQDK